MTKSQFVDALAQTTGQTKQDSERSLEGVLETLTAALKRGERIDWRGFGVFKVRDAKARQAKKVATFKPGKEFAASLNQDGASPA